MSKERELLQRIVDYADAYLEIDMEFIPAIKELLIQPAVGAPHPESLRDHFAGLAMQGVVVSRPTWEDTRRIALTSYEMADAMLMERSKRDE
jgi:hypothetical protein